jgi:glycosyltransferase involved in cell wall biosynthesis
MAVQLLWLICLLTPFAGWSMTSPQNSRTIAVIALPDFRGEFAFAHRIQIAGERLGWRVDVIDPSTPSDQAAPLYDFAVYLTPQPEHKISTRNYLAIFHPKHHYFNSKGALSQKYRGYDGYLLCYSPEEHHGIDACHLQPWMRWYPTVQAVDSSPERVSHLFHICANWGDRKESPKMQELLTLLDQEPFVRFYGAPAFAKRYPHSYQSPLPFDPESVVNAAHAAGVSLVLHSEEHNACGLPSGRIFEAAAAATVIICDNNPFVRAHFGDSVLYIDTAQNGKSIHAQIVKWMEWIRDNPELALTKAKEAHAIYRSQFTLESQLLQLEAFYQEQTGHALYRIFMRWGRRWLGYPLF